MTAITCDVGDFYPHPGMACVLKTEAKVPFDKTVIRQSKSLFLPFRIDFNPSILIATFSAYAFFGARLAKHLSYNPRNSSR